MIDLFDLDKEQLISFINCYNDYINNFYEEHDRDSFPVCVYEFFDNEYQDILRNREGV